MRCLDRDGSTSKLRSWAMPRETWRLCELQCSVQWRFQKIVKLSPTHLLDEDGTGTFEYLANSQTAQWVSLEINPRIQVEHTATEELTNLDLVRVQLLFSSATLAPLDLTPASIGPRQGCAIPCASCLKTPPRTSASPPSSIVWPADRGVHVDAWLRSVPSCNIGTYFDSLLAKIVVRSGIGEAMQRVVRVLRETSMGNDNEEGGVKTDEGIAEKVPSASGSGSLAMQPGAIFHLSLPRPGSKATSNVKKDTRALTSIAHSTSPAHFSGPLQSTFSVKQGQSSAGVAAGAFDLADLPDNTHVAAALTEKIIELHRAVWLSGVMAKGDAIAVLSVMKMKSMVVVPGGGKALIWGGCSAAHVVGYHGPARGAEQAPPMIAATVHCL
ncbi:hypothetical protein FIBSPDRAFT_894184 [Athelia psychrophila]|uniref:Carbamoyl phosphate synthase ATP-binding domain-containing protein n=1 Tax=Athelia psychrophila TaxID=1759441 RepID=A0A166G9I9_9AGAM|nr:hypothetical protein FIBSPDRAFT_894184 [Fibularhizoctonia sp. CBS 109695]